MMMMGQRRAASARARTPGLDGVARVSPPSFAIQASGSNDSSLQESLSTKGSRLAHAQILDQTIMPHLRHLAERVSQLTAVLENEDKKFHDGAAEELALLRDIAALREREEQLKYITKKNQARLDTVVQTYRASTGKHTGPDLTRWRLPWLPPMAEWDNAQLVVWAEREPLLKSTQVPQALFRAGVNGAALARLCAMTNIKSIGAALSAFSIVRGEAVRLLDCARSFNLAYEPRPNPFLSDESESDSSEAVAEGDVESAGNHNGTAAAAAANDDDDDDDVAAGAAVESAASRAKSCRVETVRTMDELELAEWIRAHRKELRIKESTIEKLKLEEIDGPALMRLGTSEFREIGLSIGQRLAIQDLQHRLRAPSVPRTAESEQPPKSEEKHTKPSKAITDSPDAPQKPRELWVYAIDVKGEDSQEGQRWGIACMTRGVGGLASTDSGIAVKLDAFPATRVFLKDETQGRMASLRSLGRIVVNTEQVETMWRFHRRVFRLVTRCKADKATQDPFGSFGESQERAVLQYLIVPLREHTDDGPVDNGPVDSGPVDWTYARQRLDGSDAQEIDLGAARAHPERYLLYHKRRAEPLLIAAVRPDITAASRMGASETTFGAYYAAKHQVTVAPDTPFVETYGLFSPRQAYTSYTSKEYKNVYLPIEVLATYRLDFRRLGRLVSVLNRVETWYRLELLRRRLDVKGAAQLLQPAPRHMELIQSAVTHKSANDVVDYERLEYLGDAVLKLAQSLHLVLRQRADPSTCRHSFLEPKASSKGDASFVRPHLSRTSDTLRWLQAQRSRLESHAALKPVFKRWRLGDYVQTVAFSPRDWCPPFFSPQKSPVVSLHEKLQSDVVESLVGAWYAWGGYTAAQRLMESMDLFGEGDGCEQEIVVQQHRVSTTPGLEQDGEPEAQSSPAPPATDDCTQNNTAQQGSGTLRQCVEQLSGYLFQNERLLSSAFCRSASLGPAEGGGGFRHGWTHEQLWWLGDALVRFVLVGHLYAWSQDTETPRAFDEGKLNAAATRIISGRSLANRLKGSGLVRFVRPPSDTDAVLMNVLKGLVAAAFVDSGGSVTVAQRVLSGLGNKKRLLGGVNA